MTGKANETALAGKPDAVALKRSLTLPYAVLYGMGVTIGAGIYVLIGAAAARAGMHAPLAFVAAALLMGLTAASFAELGGRMPVAAGEAAYVLEAFGSRRWAAAVGVLVIAIAVVAAAAISVGSAGYIAVFVSLPHVESTSRDRNHSVRDSHYPSFPSGHADQFTLVSAATASQAKQTTSTGQSACHD